MTTFQKVIKYLAMAFAVFLTVSIIGGLLSAVGLFSGFTADDAVLEDTRVYEVRSEIQSLDIQINAADFAIKQAEAFSVESNLKYLSVSEDDGVLTIKEEKKYTATYTDALLTLYIPAGAAFDKINIITGAARLTAEPLIAESVKLQLGAGDVRIESLTASVKADIEGGAGKITVDSGTLNDLELKMGVGELNLTAALLGSSELTFGVGESNLTLLGSKDDYRVEVEKGLGNITVDGKSVTDFGNSGSGENHVEIEGGIGRIDLRFCQPGDEPNSSER